MLLPRTLSGTLARAVEGFPAVLVTGPRQSGKTTLLRSLYGESHAYVSLEAPHVRERAVADPVGFLADHPPPVILDEVQHAPDLLSYLQVAIDEDRRPGQWLLSGSQSFPLLQGTSESLAGRVAILTLLPLSWSETQGRGRPEESAETALQRLLAARPGGGASSPSAQAREDLAGWILRGGFPQLWSRERPDLDIWMSSYVQTYLERDVRSVLAVKDLGSFQAFLRLAAARTGQILNLTDLARDAGVSPPTVRQWLSVLEASHQVLLLRPYFENFGKRVIKSPKLYWLDTGIVSFLLGLRDSEMPCSRVRSPGPVRNRCRRQPRQALLPPGLATADLVLALPGRLGGRPSPRAGGKAPPCRDQVHGDASPVPRRGPHPLASPRRRQGRGRPADLRRRRGLGPRSRGAGPAMAPAVS